MDAVIGLGEDQANFGGALAALDLDQVGARERPPQLREGRAAM